MQTVRQLHVGCRLPASPVAAHNRTRAPTDVARPASLPTSHTSWFYLDQPHLAGVQGFYPSLWTNHIPAPIASLRPALPPPIGLAPGRSGAVLAPRRCAAATLVYMHPQILYPHYISDGGGRAGCNCGRRFEVLLDLHNCCSPH